MKQNAKKSQSLQLVPFLSLTTLQNQNKNLSVTIMKSKFFLHFLVQKKLIRMLQQEARRWCQQNNGIGGLNPQPLQEHWFGSPSCPSNIWGSCGIQLRGCTVLVEPKNCSFKKAGLLPGSWQAEHRPSADVTWKQRYDSVLVPLLDVPQTVSSTHVSSQSHTMFTKWTKWKGRLLNGRKHLQSLYLIEINIQNT